MQRDDSFILADHLEEKVEAYIQEHEALDDKTFVWVDYDSLSIYIGSETDDYPGEVRIPLSDFILVEKGRLIPDDDQIHCFAASWPGPRK